MEAKRRVTDYSTMDGMKAWINSQPPLKRAWYKFWQFIYGLVSIVSYILLVIGAGYSFYHGVLYPDVEKAVLAGLFTVLIIYVNKVNPK